VAKEKEPELIEPAPKEIGGEAEVPEIKEPVKDPLVELEARLTAKFEKEIKERDDRIAALNKPKEQPGPTVVEKIDIYKDLGTKIWEDTPAALKSLRDEIKKEVSEELRGEYRAQKSEEKFWDDFYRSNKSFSRDDDHWVVQAVVNENFSQWKDLPVNKVKEELAKETEKRLARIEARKERNVDKSAPTMGLSSSSSPSPKREPAEEKPKTLSQMIRDKQQMRQTALFKRQESRGRDDQGRFRKDVN
jgi:hypothetical protein